jgi:hypothetical protein
MGLQQLQYNFQGFQCALFILSFIFNSGDIMDSNKKYVSSSKLDQVLVENYGVSEGTVSRLKIHNLIDRMKQVSILVHVSVTFYAANLCTIYVAIISRIACGTPNLNKKKKNICTASMTVLSV